ncbi:MAG: decaprenyl-phosphate phosphoribosyltransferase [Elusimicrobia bacterium]|nr:decaprenyl-phosphate phosphoribosyltransferase [Elusimicrobiota bacterium]
MKVFKNFFESMRPKQWIKNLFIFAGILFSKNFFDIGMLSVAISAFIVFCLLSGAVYIINDIFDKEQDKKHPLKAKRPIASGKLQINMALGGALILIVISLGVSLILNVNFFWAALIYLIIQLGYSFYFKKEVILDVFFIAAGFVLRVIAGAEVIDVEISKWLIISTIAISLFLALVKRRHEIEILAKGARQHRKVLDEYSSTYLLDQMISVVTAFTIICYTLYTISPETVYKFGTENLIFTIPFVLYGILRYLYLVHKKGEGGNPEKILVSDKPLLVNILLWVIASAVIIYK